jgi:N-methylhydantoinase B/oxoprolinase/acetone carboxylase alpha subunit
MTGGAELSFWLLLVGGPQGQGRCHTGCADSADGMLSVCLSVQLEFLRPLTACMLSERRAVRPFGLLGGGAGQPGLNLIIRRAGHAINLGAKACVQLQVPGGGGATL